MSFLQNLSDPAFLVPATFWLEIIIMAMVATDVVVHLATRDKESRVKVKEPKKPKKQTQTVFRKPQMPKLKWAKKEKKEWYED